MNRRDLGLEITEVPGVEYIKAERSENSVGGAHVAIKFGAIEEELSFGIDELGEFIQALTEADERARSMAVYE